MTYSFELKIADFVLAINAVKHAMPVKDVRYYLNGIKVEVGDVHATFIATDGHRLATCKPFVTAPIPIPVAFGFTIDADQIPLILAWCKLVTPKYGTEPKISVEYAQCSEGGETQPDGSVTVARALPGKLRLCANGSEQVYRTRPHNEKFPDWRRVMRNPESFKNPICGGAFNGEYLADVAKVAKLFNQKYGGIKIKLDIGLALFECTNSEGVEFRETLMGMRV